jgi:hypothetical protein
MLMSAYKVLKKTLNKQTELQTLREGNHDDRQC